MAYSKTLMLLVAGGCLALTAHAETAGSSADDSGQRVNLSGKLRMLSQRIPAAACFQAAGVAEGEATALLSGAAEEFAAILGGLEEGDDALGIYAPEVDRRVLMNIADLNAAWEPIQPDLASLMEGDVTRGRVEGVVRAEAGLLDIAKRLVSEIVGEHADPYALTQASALAIDIAGRQRMLAQRMSKSACMITEDLEYDRAMGELAGAREIYHNSLMALRNGLPEVGIIDPPTPEIEAKLDEVIALWEAFQPLLDIAVAGEATDDQRADIMRTANALTGTMNQAVELYTAAALQDRI